jgi:hypothetical protein
MSGGAAHVARHLSQILRREVGVAVKHGVAFIAAPQTSVGLFAFPEAPHFVAVATPVPGFKAVEAQPSWAVAGDVIGVAAQMARPNLGRAGALRLPVPAAAAPEAAHRRELEVVVEVPRIPQQTTYLVVLAVVLVVRRVGRALSASRGDDARRRRGRWRVSRRRIRRRFGGARRRLVEYPRLPGVILLLLRA